MIYPSERRVYKRCKFKVHCSCKKQTLGYKTGFNIRIGFVLLVFGVISCTGPVSMPKPMGYYRIELPQTLYKDLSINELPFSFNVSQLVTVEAPSVETSENWINLTYPALNAKIYCSYLQITPADLSILEGECRELVSRNIRNADVITEQIYENPAINVYGKVFRIDGETASPVQFLLTDSASRFFRGALYYECKPNADSLSPVTQYLNENVIELIQSFQWK